MTLAERTCKQTLYMQVSLLTNLLHWCSRSSPRDNVDALLNQESEYPIVGRDAELNIFEHEIKQILNNPNKGTQRQVLVYEGESGIGKTKIIDATSAIAYKHETL